MTNTKVWLQDVNFDFEATQDYPLGPHLAYTTPSQGGAASGMNNPLVLKSSDPKAATEALEVVKKAKEVSVALSMEDFLVKFFGMWRDDAAMLAKVLGYETGHFDKLRKEAEEWDDEWKKDYLDKIDDDIKNIYLMKGLAEGAIEFKDVGLKNQVEILGMQEAIEKDFSNAQVSMRLDDFLSYFKEELSEEEQEDSFYHYEQREGGMVPVLNENFFEQRINDMDFMKSVSLKEISNLTEEQKLKVKMFQCAFEKGLLSGNSPVEGKGEVGSTTESVTKTKTETHKGETNSMSEKKVEDLEKAANEQADLIKALTEQVESFQKREEERFEKELLEKAAAFEFVKEEQAPAVAKILKSLDGESATSLLELFGDIQAQLLEKSKEKANAEMFTQKSVSGEPVVSAPEKQGLLSAVNKALKIEK